MTFELITQLLTVKLQRCRQIVPELVVTGTVESYCMEMKLIQVIMTWSILLLQKLFILNLTFPYAHNFVSCG